LGLVCMHSHLESGNEKKIICSIMNFGKLIVECYLQGYSQHMMAKILELNQATVNRGPMLRTRAKRFFYAL